MDCESRHVQSHPVPSSPIPPRRSSGWAAIRSTPRRSIGCSIKQRDITKGLILIAADFDALVPFVEPLDDTRMAAIQATWPGPNTWLMPARPETPPWLTGAHDSIAVRVTAHPVAAALCRAHARLTSGSGSLWGSRAGALVSTSANLSNRQPSRNALGVRLQLANAPDLIVTGTCDVNARPSTIRDARTGRVLRA